MSLGKNDRPTLPKVWNARDVGFRVCYFRSSRVCILRNPRAYPVTNPLIGISLLILANITLGRTNGSFFHKCKEPPDIDPVIAPFVAY